MLDFDAESAVTDEGVNAKSALIGVAVCGGSLVDAESAITGRVVNAKSAVIAMFVGLPSVGVCARSEGYHGLARSQS